MGSAHRVDIVNTAMVKSRGFARRSVSARANSRAHDLLESLVIGVGALAAALAVGTHSIGITEFVTARHRQNGSAFGRCSG